MQRAFGELMNTFCNKFYKNFVSYDNDCQILFHHMAENAHAHAQMPARTNDLLQREIKYIRETVLPASRVKKIEINCRTLYITGNSRYNVINYFRLSFRGFLIKQCDISRRSFSSVPLLNNFKVI